jgi:hypothetical protein
LFLISLVNNYMKKSLFFAAIFISLAVVLPSVASAASWGLTDYGYRFDVAMSQNRQSQLEQFQILATPNTAQLISQGKMKSDCSDIRVTDSDGITQLPYWIEDGCNTSSTKIWVRVPVIPTDVTKVIYVYHGNTSAYSMSNIDTVMDQGLRAMYYYPQIQYGLDWATFAGDCIDTQISHQWGASVYLSGCPSNTPASMRITWYGWVINKGAGTHTFNIRADGGGSLEANGSKILSWTNLTNAEDRSVSQYMSTITPIELIWGKTNNDRGTIEFGWTPADGSGRTTPIPVQNLRSRKLAYTPDHRYPYPRTGIGSAKSYGEYQQETSQAQQQASQSQSSTSYSNSSSLGQSSAYSPSAQVTGEFVQKIKNITRENGTESAVEAYAGELVRFSFVLKSGQSFNNTKVIDVLPSYVSFVSASTGGAYSQSNNSVQWNLGNITYPDTTYYYEAKVLAPVRDNETNTNVAMLFSDNKTLATNQVQYNIKSPNIILIKEKIVPPTQGAALTYKITYRNIGSRQGKLALREEFTAPLKFMSASPSPVKSDTQSVSFEVLNIQPQDSGTIVLNYTSEGDAALPQDTMPRTRASYYDDRGYQYPEIVLDGSGSSQNNNATQGQVKGALDVSAGSEKIVLVAMGLAVFLAIAWYLLNSIGTSRLKFSYALYRAKKEEKSG